MKRIKMPDGISYLVKCAPLYRRGIAWRASDWLAMSGRRNTAIGWGRTRREALAHLVEQTGGEIVPRSR
jgi:hypothetical protein